MKDFLNIADADDATLADIFDRAFNLRDERNQGKAHAPILQGQTLALIFAKPSLRTRVSFEQAMNELGGHAIVLGNNEIGLGIRESVADVARVLNGMVHGIAARVFDHEHLVQLAHHSTLPVINMLSDATHPCQALADAMTIMDEFGRTDLAGRTVAFIGDGNNVAHSLAAICGRLGMNFTLACPKGYDLPAEAVTQLRRENPTLRMTLTHDVNEAVAGADVLYTDTWVSMGQEEEKALRQKAFAGFTISEEMLQLAAKHAIVLHCLPAYRGLEITDGAMEGPQSRVFPQAHNRLHAQKGLLSLLMGK